MFVALGWILRDTVAQIDTYPREDAKVAAASVWHQAGGPVVRASLLLARFKASATVIAAVGDDEQGRAVCSELERAGVATSAISVAPRARTREALVLLSGDTGSRTIAYSSTGPALPYENRTPLLDGAEMVLLDGRERSAADALTLAARRAGVPCAMDLGSPKPASALLAARCDVVVGPQESWLTVGRSDRLHDAMAVTDARVAVATAGPKTLVARLNGEFVEFDVPPVSAVRDSNGAGDVFFGALSWAVVRCGVDVDAVRFAHAAVTIKLARRGNAGLPTLAEVRSAMRGPGMLKHAS